MKILLPALISLGLIGAANANIVELINGSPAQGVMSVQYQLMYQGGRLGAIRTAVLPKHIQLPKGARGINVTTLTNAAIPTPGHNFKFPNHACELKRVSLGISKLVLSTSNQVISCANR